MTSDLLDLFEASTTFSVAVAGHVGLPNPLPPAKGSVALRGLRRSVQPRGSDLRAAEGPGSVGFGQGRSGPWPPWKHPETEWKCGSGELSGV